VSFPKRVLAMASVLLCWAPVLGVLVGMVATLTNLRTPGWPRWVSIAGLLLAAGINIAMFATLFHEDAQALEPVAMMRSSAPA
jgi:xanthosine utilization system XapX-like protein